MSMCDQCHSSQISISVRMNQDSDSQTISNYCSKCFFVVYPDARIVISERLIENEKQTKAKVVLNNKAKPIIIYGPVGVYAVTCLYILDPSKSSLPSDLRNIIYSCDYRSMGEDFFDKCQKFSSDWWVLTTFGYNDWSARQAYSAILKLITKFGQLDKILQVTEDSTDTDTQLTVNQLLKKLQREWLNTTGDTVPHRPFLCGPDNLIKTGEE